MTPKATEARLKYLEKASECLLVSCPALSAHIRAEYDAISWENDDGTPSQAPLRSCNACGNILIPGWSCNKVKQKRAAGARQRKAKIQGEAHRSSEISCRMCGVVTFIEILKSSQEVPKLPIGPKRRLHAYESILRSDSPSAQQPLAMDAKAPSRKRKTTKSRLQAMLADQKLTASSKGKTFGLDLVDLMQS